jgi:hypothetical protein
MSTLQARQRVYIAIAVAASVVIGISVWVSLDPNNYFFYDEEERQRWRYPTAAILVLCGVYVAESFFIASATKLDGVSRLWPRTLVAALLFLPWSGLCTLFVMHASAVVHVHVVWTWLLSAVLVFVTLGSAIRHAFHAIWGGSHAI